MIVRSLALIPLSRRIDKGINAFISRSSLTHAHFIEMITYKATLVGIRAEVREESYTSKASFLDLDEIPVYDPENKEEHVFSGRRKRSFDRKRLRWCLRAGIQYVLVNSIKMWQ
jgi:hypothetical protein